MSGAVQQGRESVVYGCICDMDFGQAELRHATNSNAVLALPDREGWPLISREMFSLPVLDRETGAQLVHFGSCYRGVEYEWVQWLQQFETLLKQMYWVSATVQLESELYGVHSFNWDASGDFHAPGSDDIRLYCEWRRGGTL